MAGEHAFSMAVHEPHPGRTCRSVSFDDGKRRVIATDLDPDVDPLNLKPILGRPPTPRPSRTDCTTSSSPDAQYDELGEGSSRPPSAASEEGVSAAAAALRMEMEMLPMATHESYPGRRWRSVSFDDGKRHVIATELDPEVDMVKLKPIVGRPPTPRPSRTDCTTSSSPDGQYYEFGEGSSRPPSAASGTGASAAAATQQPDKSLDPELLMTRLTLECDGLEDKDRAATETAQLREHGKGRTDHERDVDRPAAEELSSEGGGRS
ncbi:uncharacterized protein LOC144104665 isoform X2 [Amblyomma americanum]